MIPVASSSTTPSKTIDAFQLPVSPDLQQLTPSQRIFSIATRTDIRSLTISGDVEFYLFMQLRAERGWATFKMTSLQMGRRDGQIQLEARKTEYRSKPSND